MKYTDLKAKQQEFVQWLFDDGNHNQDKTTFQRGYLKRIANDNGMAWAPAWIVKDTNRVSKRGFYIVPELVDFIRSAGDGMEDEEDVLIERMRDEAASESESSLEETPVESSAQTVAV
tara:strand:+ start:433 stop:786 length:354 start_codon:yes stop_codon:yes gene_type:complete